MLLAKSRPIVVICITDGSFFAREGLTAFTPWQLDAVSGSHPPHPLSRHDQLRLSGRHGRKLAVSRMVASCNRKVEADIHPALRSGNSRPKVGISARVRSARKSSHSLIGQDPGLGWPFAARSLSRFSGCVIQRAVRAAFKPLSRESRSSRRGWERKRSRLQLKLICWKASNS
jgi:hypothetical protein